MVKNEENLYSISYESAKEYLEFVEQVFINIEVKKQICIDFHNALLEQKAKQNLFISWCMSNYYDCLILNLCKLTEPRKNDKNKYTLKHFINLLKYKPNYDMLVHNLQQKTVDVHNMNTGKIEKESVAEEYLRRLKAIDFAQDLDEIDKIHKKISEYRNKKICHNEKTMLTTQELPSIDELHVDIEKIEKLMKSYFSLFGIHIIYDSLKTPNFYNNFKLSLT